MKAIKKVEKLKKKLKNIFIKLVFYQLILLLIKKNILNIFLLNKIYFNMSFKF